MPCDCLEDKGSLAHAPSLSEVHDDSIVFALDINLSDYQFVLENQSEIALVEILI